MLKAIEVSLMTGRPYSSLLTGQKKERGFHIVKIGIQTEREILYDRINCRVDEMIRSGLIEEAKALYPFKKINPLNTVGYKELFDAFDNKIRMDEAIELIKRNTRRYAKRQVTWFQRDNDIRWFEPGQKNAIILHIDKSLNQDLSISIYKSGIIPKSLSLPPDFHRKHFTDHIEIKCDKQNEAHDPQHGIIEPEC